MESREVLHWRALGSCDYLRAELFQPGEEKVLTIKEVKQEEVTSPSNKKDKRPIIYFKESGILPMVLNVTNCKVIEKIYGTGNVYEWINKKIQVFATQTKVAGEVVPCLRIRNFAPKTEEVEYKCAICGKNIPEKLFKQSVEKYGKAYCSKECHEIDVNGEQIL